MAHRHLNPVIKDYIIPAAIGAVLAAAFLYGMFTCHLINFPELN